MRNFFALAAVAVFAAVGSPAHPQNLTTPPEVSCKVAEVAVYADRVHVFCSEGGVTVGAASSSAAYVRYFAVAISDPIAPHMIAIAGAALASQRPIAVTFDPSASANPPGCGVSDCRRALVVKGYGG